MFQKSVWPHFLHLWTVRQKGVHPLVKRSFIFLLDLRRDLSYGEYNFCGLTSKWYNIKSQESCSIHVSWKRGAVLAVYQVTLPGNLPHIMCTCNSSARVRPWLLDLSLRLFTDSSKLAPSKRKLQISFVAPDSSKKAWGWACIMQNQVTLAWLLFWT